MKFKREGSRLVLELEGQYPIGNWKYFFTHDMTGKNEDYQALLENNLRTAFYDLVRAAKEEAYKAGWKDAKAKRGQNGCFSGLLGNP